VGEVSGKKQRTAAHATKEKISKDLEVRMKFHNANPWVLKLLVYFVGHANTEPSEFRGIVIRKGQMLRSLDRIIKDLEYPVQQATFDKHSRQHRIPKSTLRRYIDYMETAQLIKTQSTRLGTLITINDYDVLANVVLMDLVHVDTEQLDNVVVNNNNNKRKNTTTITPSMLLDTATDILSKSGREAAMEYCERNKMSNEDIQRVISPAQIPADFRRLFKKYDKEV
jgi:hypothetical protein